MKEKKKIKLKEPTYRIKRAIFEGLEKGTRERPVKLDPLFHRVNQLLYPYEHIANPRTLRLYIQWLRGEDPRGSTICSTMGAGGGRWFAKDRHELNEFMGKDKAQITTISRRWNKQYALGMQYLKSKPQMSFFDIESIFNIEDEAIPSTIFEDHR